MKKIVLINSDITYIPDNYISVLKKIISQNPDKEFILVLTRVNKVKLLKNIFLLFLAGARNLAFVLLKNLFLRKKKKKFFQAKKIKVLEAESVNDIKFIDFLKNEKVDLIFNLRSRQIFKKEICKNFLILNLHHGVLPNNRGVFSDMRNLAFGGELGFSIHKVNEKIDDGEILAVKKIEYQKNKNYLGYLKFSTEIEAEFVGRWVKNIDKNLKLLVETNTIDFIFYKNPDWKDIKKMRKQGLVL